METLNIISYCMGLILAFKTGVFFGMWAQRQMIANALATGRQQVEALFSNLFKKGVRDAQTTDNSNDRRSGVDTGAHILAGGWQTSEKIVFGETVKGRVTGYSGSGASENYSRSEAGASAESWEGFGSEAGGEEESQGSGPSAASGAA